MGKFDQLMVHSRRRVSKLVCDCEASENNPFVWVHVDASGGAYDLCAAKTCEHPATELVLCEGHKDDTHFVPHTHYDENGGRYVFIGRLNANGLAVVFDGTKPVSEIGQGGQTRDLHHDKSTEKAIEKATEKAIEKATEKETEKATEKASESDATAILDSLRDLLGANNGDSITQSEIERIAREVAEKTARDLVKDATVRTVAIKDGVTRDIGRVTHRQTQEVLKWVAIGQNVYMHGPAGAGKSTLAEDVAELLDKRYGQLSLSMQTGAHEFMGWHTPGTGEYNRTALRECFEHGGVFHFDEMDAASPNTLTLINAIAARNTVTFPDATIKAHKDFVLMASGNTIGQGANREYVGRNALDAATLNRYAFIDVAYDEPLEKAICEATGADEATVTRVIGTVKKMRDLAERAGVNAVISPRDSQAMCAGMVAGLTWDDVVSARLRRGMENAAWQKLVPALT